MEALAARVAAKGARRALQTDWAGQGTLPGALIAALAVARAPRAPGRPNTRDRPAHKEADRATKEWAAAMAAQRSRWCSVSSLARDYREGFDAPAVLAKMKTSREPWPRLRYAVNAVALDPAAEALVAADQLVMLVTAQGKTAFAGPAAAAPGGPGALRKAARAAPPRLYSYDRAMTDDEVLARWDCPEARNRGTEAHAQMELWLNSEPARTGQPEVAVGLAFVREQLAPLGVRAFRTEWEIYADEEDVAGSLDFIGTRPDGALVIVDWKRSPKLQEHMRGHFRKFMAWPLDHLNDCDGAAYALQLSAYAWILEKYYGVKIDGLALCSLHPDAPFHTWVPYLRLEIDYLMRQRREHAAARRVLDVTTGAGAPRCALSGRLAHDAVTVRCPGRALCDAGAICSERALAVADEAATFDVCTAARDECARLLRGVTVDRATYSHELGALQCGAVPWSTRKARRSSSSRVVLPVPGGPSMMHRRGLAAGAPPNRVGQSSGCTPHAARAQRWRSWGTGLSNTCIAPAAGARPPAPSAGSGACATHSTSGSAARRCASRRAEERGAAPGGAASPAAPSPSCACAPAAGSAQSASGWAGGAGLCLSARCAPGPGGPTPAPSAPPSAPPRHCDQLPHVQGALREYHEDLLVLEPCPPGRLQHSV